MNTAQQRYCLGPSPRKDAVRVACEGAALFVQNYLVSATNASKMSCDPLFDVIFMCKDEDGWFWAFTRDQQALLQEKALSSGVKDSEFIDTLNHFRFSTAGFINLLERTENLTVRVDDFQKEKFICVDVGYQIEPTRRFAENFAKIEAAIPGVGESSFLYFCISSYTIDLATREKYLAAGSLVAVFRLDRAIMSSPDKRMRKMTIIREWVEKWRHQKETFTRVKEIVADVARPYQTITAATAILSRNMSHHIGSHIMPRATVKDVTSRLETLYEGGRDIRKSETALADDVARVLSGAERLKTTLDDFIQKKADFLAEVTTDPNSSSDSKRLGRDILAPLMRNALLMDNIARNEGFGYKLRPESCLSKNDHKVISLAIDTYRPYAKAQRLITSSLRLSLCISEDGGCRRILGPNLPPYDPLYGASKDKQFDVFSVDSDYTALDPLIAVPGMVGQYALYGILENIIRNAAKHGTRTDCSEGLHIQLHVEDDPEHPADYYRLSIWDDRADPANVKISATIPGDPKGEKRERWLAEHLDCWAQADLIDPSGAVRREAWGVAEIVICANLLAGRTQYAYDEKFIKILEGNSPHDGRVALDCCGQNAAHEGCQKSRLIHQVRLLKAKRAVLVGTEFAKMWAVTTQNALKKEGVYVFKSAASLKVFLGQSEARQAFQFAVLEDDEGMRAVLAESKENGRERSAFLAALPFRIFWMAGTTDKPDPPICRAVGVSVGQFSDLGKAPSAGDIMERLWQLWIGGNDQLNLGKQKRKVTAVVYLDVASGEEPYKTWAPAVISFNAKSNSPVKMCILSNDNQQEGILPTDGSVLRAAFTRHRDQGLGSLGPDDLYEAFGKRSADCDLLLGANPPGEHESFWELPYALAEAGLVRIVVLDERMSERAMAPLAGTLAIREDRLLENASFAPCFWHLAHRAKVYMATHLQVGDCAESMMPLHGQSFNEAKARMEKLSSGLRVACPVLKVRITENAGLEVAEFNRCGPNLINEPKEAWPRFDIVVIHQGVIDTRRPKKADGGFAINEEDMRNWITKSHPWLVVESGRGIPPGLQKKPIRFLAFSVLDSVMTPDGVGKLFLTRRLMALPRFVENGGIS